MRRRRTGHYMSFKALHVLVAIGAPGADTTANWTAKEVGMSPHSTRRTIRRFRSMGYVEQVGRAWISTSRGYIVARDAMESKLKGFRYSDPTDALKAIRDTRVVADRLRAWGWRGHLVHRALRLRPLKRIQHTIRTAIRRADNNGPYARACLFAKNAILARAANWAAVVFGGVRGAIRLFLRATQKYGLRWREVKRLTRELVKERGDPKTMFSWQDVGRAMRRVRPA